MSGKQDLEQQLDTLLDEYEEKYKLKFPDIVDEDLSEYLNMSRDYIEALPKEERYSIAIKLAQSSFYIQRLVNREKARVSWCNSCINSMCAKHWDEFDKWLKADIKIHLIAKEHKIIDKIIRIRNNAQVHVDNLDHLSGSLKYMADLLSRSAYGKE